VFRWGLGSCGVGGGWVCWVLFPSGGLWVSFFLGLHFSLLFLGRGVGRGVSLLGGYCLFVVFLFS